MSAGSGVEPREIVIPPMPPARGEDLVGRAELLPRYEDVAQDGRMFLAPMAPGLGVAIWRALLRHLPASKAFQAQGVLPILSRMVIVGEERTVSVHGPIRYEGRFRFARERGGDRIFVNMWLDAFAPIGSTFGPAPAKDAEAPLVGRIFAEHVVTRPFAPPGERKVTSLEAPGMPAVPDDEHSYENAEALADGARFDEPPIAIPFGVMHTDSNQHVNSLVYPRIVEEHATARLPADERKRVFARAIDVRWRKPFFAGDVASLDLRVDGRDALGVWRTEPGGKPSCAVAIRLG